MSNARGTTRRLEARTRTQLVRAYRDGASINEVAARFRCAYGTVEYWLRRSGVARRPLGRTKGARPIPRDQDDAFRAAVAQGVTQTQLAHRFGISTTSVYRWKAALGIRSPQCSTRRDLTLTVSRGPVPKLFRCRCGAVVTDKRGIDECIHERRSA